MTPVSGNIRYMQIFAGFLLAGASNESGVVNECNFGDLSGYFFGNFRDKANNII